MSKSPSIVSPVGAGLQGPIGVGAVGVRPGEHDGILAELPAGQRFQFVAFSDEGLQPGPRPDTPARHFGDYNVMLREPSVEVVLVDGPVDLRRDFAVRALNAGRHVVVAPPFAETALDGERVMKTALNAGLLAAMETPWRNDPDLGALRAALAAENAGPVFGLFCFVESEQPEPSEEAGLLKRVGFGLLDKVNLLLAGEVRNVSAHLRRARGGRGEGGFFLYMPLRSGGWVAVDAALAEGAGPAGRSCGALPRWLAYAGGVEVRVADGRAVVGTGSDQRCYDAPLPPAGFWDNLHAAVRDGAALACHPAEIVRAMKLHEAALEAAELGEPVTI